MIEVCAAAGALHLPALDLWLDPRAGKTRAFVSHAHADHIGRHTGVIATPATAAFMAGRLGAEQNGVFREFDEPFEIRGSHAILLPAGHVLGSAQLFVESQDGSLLYTGDFKLRSSRSCETASFRPAETLIMETTYGKPEFVFPPAAAVERRLIDFCLSALDDDEVPVVAAYSLGKAQEVLFLLAGAGLTVQCHGAVAAMNRVCQSFRADFPEFESYDAARLNGCVLLCPPAAMRSPMVRKVPNRRTAAVTGWGIHPNARHRFGVDEVFPLSDHAGYDELLLCVEAVGPRRVLTVHGFSREFAADLRSRGIEAWAVGLQDQLALPLHMDSRGTLAPRPAAPAPPPSAEPSDFFVFASVCRSVADVPGRKTKTRILADYLAALGGEDLSAAATFLSGRPFPAAAASPVQAGPVVIRKALAEASGLPEEEVRSTLRRIRDSGRAASEVMEGRGNTASRSLTQILQFFHSLESERKPVGKVSLLAVALSAGTAVEAEFVVRILTGDLRIGLREGLLEEAVALAFGEPVSGVGGANRLLCDIGQTALLARGHALDRAEFRCLRPLRPMLAIPEPTARDLWERFSATPGFTPPLLMEEKFDGIRVQVHCDGARTALFSRDLKPLDESFPEIARSFAAAGLRAVLDGELVAIDKTGAISFADLQRRLGRRGGDLFLGWEIPVRFIAFDLLWENGGSLLHVPLADRRRRLAGLALPSCTSIAELFPVSSSAGIDTLFERARARGREGLMAKNPGSFYEAGRRGPEWIKLKKAFATLDVVVTSAGWGHGHRRAVLSDYTFSVQDQSGRSLLPIGRAYSGLTNVEIERLTAHFLSTTTRVRGNRHDVEPTVILEVAFDSVKPSNRHAAGFALRFPRILGLREDKTVAEIDTLDTVARLAGEPGTFKAAD